MKKLLLLLIALIPCMISLNACTSCTSCNSCAIVDSIFACKHADVVIDAAVAASCTETGLTEGQHCEKCGEVLVAQEIVPITHNFSEWETLKEPDCFFEGEKTRVCSLCGIVENEAIEPIEHKFVQNPDTKLFACETCDARILNGHLYAAFDTKVNWYDAYKICDKIGGHLVTITSKEEQTLMNDIISNKDFDWVEYGNDYYYFIGGIKNSNGWKWITNEEFSYTHWASKEPDNYNAVQWHIALSTNLVNQENLHAKIGDWEDIGHMSLYGFICEWELNIVEDEHYFTEWEVTTESTCFNAGEKYRICTHCGLEETEVIPQLEHNFVLNEATNITSCDKCSAAMYEGRIYKIFNVQLSWFDAYTYCDKLGGHLVTITSAEEQAFINAYMDSQAFSVEAWIGSYSDGNKWQWITNEAFEYTNWNTNQPDNYGGYQFFGVINFYKLGSWDDKEPFFAASYLICEWEAE